jgi:hypothetical protein
MHGNEFDPSTLASQALPMLVIYLRHVGGRFADRVASDLDDWSWASSPLSTTG